MFKPHSSRPRSLGLKQKDIEALFEPTHRAIRNLHKAKLKRLCVLKAAVSDPHPDIDPDAKDLLWALGELKAAWARERALLRAVAESCACPCGWCSNCIERLSELLPDEKPGPDRRLVKAKSR